jgi:hypothetical protein
MLVHVARAVTLVTVLPREFAYPRIACPPVPLLPARKSKAGTLRISLALLLIGLCLTGTTFGEELQGIPHREEFFQIPRIMEDILTLSSPQFQGRQAGTPGGEQAADFVAQRFHALGLHPPSATDNGENSSQWKQQSSVSATQVLGPPRLTFFPVGPSTMHSPLFAIPGKDFLPMFDSPSVNLTASMIFVGYGIVDPARGVDDYRGADVRNRVVMALRGKPTNYGPWITHEEKAQTAKDHGAAGFITLTGPILNRYESRKGLGQTPMAIYSAGPENRPLPGVWLDGKLGEDLFRSIGLSLQDMQMARNEQQATGPQTLPLIAHLQWTSQSVPGTLTNVLGVLPGQDTGGQDALIIVGAHRDHFGEQAGLQFPGADDNASGTAVMLELARVLSQRPTPLTHTIVFVSFDGEERGLLGSTLYVNNPAFPLKRTVAMINLDHLGVGNGKLTVGLTRMDKALAQRAGDQAGLSEQVQIYGYFPGGDHVPFYEAGVPTITVVSSGTHPHFHQPSDTTDTIQPEILKNSTKFLLSLIALLAEHPQPTGHPEPTGKDLSPS